MSNPAPASPHEWAEFVGEVRARLAHIEAGIAQVRTEIDRGIADVRREHTQDLADIHKGLDRGRDRMNELDKQAGSIQSNTDQVQVLWSKFEWIAEEIRKLPDREAQRQRDRKALWTQGVIAAATVCSVVLALLVGR